MKPDCTIVIRAFNEEKHIGKLLKGIKHQTVKKTQVILVDSGSDDGTVIIAEKFGAQIVRIEPQNFTFGRSLNHGIEAAEADLIVIASAHVYPVYPDWLATMLDPFKDERVALVYGKQRGAECAHFSEQQIFTHWYGEISIPSQTHPFCNNANSAIRKELWKKHAYDENLPGLEDLEWAQWAMENKLIISYSAEAEIIHIHEESWRAIHNRYLREGWAFKQIYPHERFNMADFIKLFFQNAVSDLKAAKKEGVMSKEFFDIMRFRWLQFLGTYHGYKRSGPLTWQLKQSFYYPKNNVPLKHQISTRKINPIEYDT